MCIQIWQIPGMNGDFSEGTLSTLKAGETFGVVVDMKKSQYCFIGNDAKKSLNYE
jgi:hypothetical protein